MASAWGDSWGAAWGDAWGVISSGPSNTPGFPPWMGLDVISARNLRRVRDERGRIVNTPQQSPVIAPLPAPDWRLAEYRSEFQKLVKILTSLNAEKSELRAEIAALQEVENERKLLMLQQKLVMSEAKIALVAEEMEAIDVAYCVAVALTL